MEHRDPKDTARSVLTPGEELLWYGRPDVEAAVAYAKELAQGPSVAVDLCRRGVHKGLDSTLDEMKRVGHPAPVGGQLDVCFRGVTKGDSYLAVSDGPDKVSFWLNGRKTCTMAYPGIKRSFMSVFLGENTRSASFTRMLQGK